MASATAGRAPVPGATAPITPREIRAMTFRVARRGLDEAAVYRFLDRVAAELDRHQTQARILRRENDTIKANLRDWQTRHAACHSEPDVAHPSAQRPAWASGGAPQPGAQPRPAPGYGWPAHSLPPRVG